MRHRQAALGAIAWPRCVTRPTASGLFVILFGVPSLLLSVVFAAVSLKAPRGGALLCTMLLASILPIVFWAGSAGYMDARAPGSLLSLAISAIGLLIALVKLMLPGRKAVPADGEK